MINSDGTLTFVTKLRWLHAREPANFHSIPIEVRNILREPKRMRLSNRRCDLGSQDLHWERKTCLTHVNTRGISACYVLGLDNNTITGILRRRHTSTQVFRDHMRFCVLDLVCELSVTHYDAMRPRHQQTRRQKMLDAITAFTRLIILLINEMIMVVSVRTDRRAPSRNTAFLAPPLHLPFFEKKVRIFYGSDTAQKRGK